MTNPFTTRIFMPDGDPEGIRIIDKLTSTGIFFVFPRDKWVDMRKREVLSGAGIYMLIGYANPDDELSTIYIGQSDSLADRIHDHFAEKDFWDLCVIFTAPGRLNSAHGKWLEYALIQRVNLVDRSILDNGNEPSEPNISEAELADMHVFLNEIYQTLPLVDIKTFEEPKPRVVKIDRKQSTSADIKDTVIVPARAQGFDDTFVGKSVWHAIRISGGMLNKLRYIAAYRTHPTSAITHWAEIKQIEPYGNEGKYKLIFKEPAKKLSKPVKNKEPKKNALQGHRYTNFQKLKQAKDVSEL